MEIEKEAIFYSIKINLGKWELSSLKLSNKYFLTLIRNSKNTKLKKSQTENTSIKKDIAPILDSIEGIIEINFGSNAQKINKIILKLVWAKIKIEI